SVTKTVAIFAEKVKREVAKCSFPFFIFITCCSIHYLRNNPMNASQSKKHTRILVCLAVLFFLTGLVLYWLTGRELPLILFSGLFAGAVVEIFRKFYKQKHSSD